METAYTLQHVSREDTDNEDVKFIGVFSSEKKALACAAKMKKLKGFKKFPDNFYIDKYKINEASWMEGFTSRKPQGVGNRRRKPEHPTKARTPEEQAKGTSQRGRTSQRGQV